MTIRHQAFLDWIMPDLPIQRPGPENQKQRHGSHVPHHGFQHHQPVHTRTHIKMSTKVNWLRRKKQRRLGPPQDQIKKITKKNSIPRFPFHQQLKRVLNLRTVLGVGISNR
jgi:hypothetical protein